MSRAMPTSFGFQVQQKQCATCIYLPKSHFDIAALERAVADPHLPGFFKGHRTCHHAPDSSGVCCRGFWNRHKDRFQAGQLAQRLNFVSFVDVDRFRKPKR